MPSAFPRGLDLSRATDLLSQHLINKGQENEAQQNLQSYLQSGQAVPQQNLQPVGSGESVPVPATDPTRMALLSKLLASPQGQTAYQAYTSSQPKYGIVHTPYGAVDITTEQPSGGGPPTVKQEIAPTYRPTNPNEYALLMDANNPSSPSQKQSQAAIAQRQGSQEALIQKKAESAIPPFKGAFDVTDAQGNQRKIGMVFDKDSGKWNQIDLGGSVPKVTALTAATKSMIDAAPTVKYFVGKINNEIDQNEQGLGPASSRWREFKAGKVGIADPAFTQLRTNMGLLQTLLMRMHVGARGGEYIMKHFQDLINSGTQSPENLRASLGEINDYADQLLSEAKQKVSPQGTQQLAQPTQQSQPKATHRFNPQTGKIEAIQ